MGVTKQTLAINSRSLPSDLLDRIYPVGSIYISMNSVDPSELFGGSWIPLNEGRVLIGANETYVAGSKGGETTHTLTIAEMPTHNHAGTYSGSGTISAAGAHTHTRGSMNITGKLYSSDCAPFTFNATTEGAFYLTDSKRTFVYNRTNADRYAPNQGSLGFSAANNWSGNTSSDGAHTHTFTVSGSVNNQGSNTPHNIMQPYLAVYMWYRES